MFPPDAEIDDPNGLCDLLRRLMDKTPSTRATLAEVMAHPWVKLSSEVIVPIHVSEQDISKAVYTINRMRTIVHPSTRV